MVVPLMSLTDMAAVGLVILVVATAAVVVMTHRHKR